MNTVGTADSRRMLKFHSPSLQNGCQSFQVVQNDIGCSGNLEAECGVSYVGGSESHVNVLGFIAHLFAYCGQERNDIVVNFCIDFMNAIYIEICFFFDNFYRFLRNAAQLGISFTCCNFNIKHCLPFVSFVPNGFHSRSCVPRNHISPPLVYLPAHRFLCQPLRRQLKPEPDLS